MHRTVTSLMVVLVGCGPPLANPDDEVGESSTSESSTSESSTSESSTTSESDESSTSDSEEFGFIPDEDGLDHPLDCNIIDQDCPEGQKCIAYASSGGVWDANKCVPVTGDQHVGEPCHYGGFSAGTDDCDALSMCWDVMEIDGELIGECVLFCSGTSDDPECPPMSSCLIASDSSVSFCISGCDPLLQDCAEGLGCFWTVDSFNCIFTAGEIPTGEPCGYINDCAPGNFCCDAAVLPECADVNCCTKFCDLTRGDADCAAQPGTACVPFFEMGQAPAGYEDVGICNLPP